jgi:hypothetical protein
MSAKAANPVVQIVDGDEQDVGLVDRTVGIGPFVRLTESEKECNRSGSRQESRIPTRQKILTTSAAELSYNVDLHFDSGIF